MKNRRILYGIIRYRRLAFVELPRNLYIFRCQKVPIVRDPPPPRVMVPSGHHLFSRKAREFFGHEGAPSVRYTDKVGWIKLGAGKVLNPKQ